MTPAFYADYVANLRALFQDLDQSTELYQTFEVHLELAAAGSLIVYESMRRKGLTDSLFYGRAKDGTSNQKISQATAFKAIDRFFSLGQFLALTDHASDAPRVNEDFPHCAVKFSYRKKGHPKTQSTVMVFIGFNDDADALNHAQSVDANATLVATRPLQGKRVYEWK